MKEIVNKKILGRKIVVAFFVILFLMLFAFSAMLFNWQRRVPTPEYRIKKPANSIVVVQEYTDFQCPACAFANRILEQVIEASRGKLELRVKHFPLGMHKWAMPAAISAECAGKQDRFFEYVHELFFNQAQWAPSETVPEQFDAYAEKLGLNMEDFTKCRENPEVKKTVLADMFEASRVTNGTPTFFVNGKKVGSINGLLEELEKLGIISLRAKENGK
jgi:protein-disulfide isomerase